MSMQVMRTVRSLLLLTTAAGLTTFSALAQQSSATAETSGQPAQSGKTDKATEKFIKRVARDNDLDMAVAEIGTRRGQNAELKRFCQQYKQDHQQANQQLEPLARKYGLTVEQSLTKHNEHELKKFDTASTGPELDRKLATWLLRDGQEDISRFETAANRVQAEDVKQYIQNTLPKLQQDFQQAQTVAKAVGIDQSTISSLTSKASGAMGGAGTGSENRTGTGSGSWDKNTKGSGAKELDQPHPSEP